MQPQPNPTPIAVRPSGVLVIDGYGIRINVNRGRLIVRDGIGRSRREASFARATCPFRRLVLLGHTGSLSFDAIRWMTDVGAGFVQLDRDGRLLIASGGLGLDDPRLRRAQALAFGTTAGMAAAVELLEAKLDGQARLASRLEGGERVAEAIASFGPALRLATTPAELLVPEAHVANTYWKAWAGVEMQWARRDADVVPEHWRTFAGRASPLTGNPRSAGNPANAILNYLYALLEVEARLACLAMGLDPGLGVLHADLRARDSLALDVMEAVRPEVDAYLLELLSRRVFRRADFVESRQGGCRALAPLTHELAETLLVWRGRLAPVVEKIALAFAAAPGSRVDRLPMKLTEANRSAGRDSLRHGSRSRPKIRTTRQAACVDCGDLTPHPDRGYCDACLPEATERQRAAFIAGGNAELRRQQAAGKDPSHGGDAGRRRGAKVAESRRAAAEWKRFNGQAPGPEVFRRDILPRIQDVSASKLAEQTGLSRPYCNAIIRGEKIPHARRWETIRAGRVDLPSESSGPVQSCGAETAPGS